MSFHSQEEISSLLADWAIKEMGFQNSEHKEPTGAPSLTGLDLSGYAVYFKTYFNLINDWLMIMIEFV